MKGHQCVGECKEQVSRASLIPICCGSSRLLIDKLPPWQGQRGQMTARTGVLTIS